MKPPSPIVIEAALERLAAALAAWGALKVIAFGSVARGDYSGASDIDLIVVKRTTDRFPERIREALGPCWATDPPLPVEPLVYTPEEFTRLLAEENPLVTEAVRHGRVLYDQA
jgi:predicted nucleotidyltransferase